MGLRHPVQQRGVCKYIEVSHLEISPNKPIPDNIGLFGEILDPFAER